MLSSTGPNVAARICILFTTCKPLKLCLLCMVSLAAALPVWLLLAPRDYLSTYQNQSTQHCLVLITVCQFKNTSNSLTSGAAVLYWRFKYSLTSSLLSHVVRYLASILLLLQVQHLKCLLEKEILPYLVISSTLTEGFIAMMALIAATALHPDDYLCD